MNVYSYTITQHRTRKHATNKHSGTPREIIATLFSAWHADPSLNRLELMQEFLKLQYCF